jgi:hypothetical protein
VLGVANLQLAAAATTHRDRHLAAGHLVAEAASSATSYQIIQLDVAILFVEPDFLANSFAALTGGQKLGNKNWGHSFSSTLVVRTAYTHCTCQYYLKQD